MNNETMNNQKSEIKNRQSCILANLFFITSIACLLLSTKINLRSNSCAAIPVVPLPAKKSSTVSPLFDETATMRLKTPKGFCVG